MDKNVLVTAAQRLLEYVKNPHHINPMSAAFTALVEEASSLLAQTAEQHQGEPVAWLVHGPTGCMGAYMKDPSHWAHGYRLQPLYTHPDAGEVERLRIELAEQREIFGMQEDKIDTLRAQLAEQYAALFEIRKMSIPDGKALITAICMREIAVKTLSAGAEPSVPKLSIWYGSMPESNGKANWTAILHRGDISEGITIDRSEYPGRVRYEADRFLYMIGELSEPPCILDYDTDEHSGYNSITPVECNERVAFDRFTGSRQTPPTHWETWQARAALEKSLEN